MDAQRILDAAHDAGLKTIEVCAGCGKEDCGSCPCGTTKCFVNPYRDKIKFLIKKIPFIIRHLRATNDPLTLTWTNILSDLKKLK